MGDQDSKLIWESLTPHRSHADVHGESERMKQLFEHYYHELIDQHGGDKAATSYTGLTPGAGDSEALQFLNVLVYIADVLSPSKKEILKAMITADKLDDHMNMAYELSELSTDELNRLLDGGSLPF